MRKLILLISVFTVMLVSACGFMDFGRVRGSGNVITEERAVSGFTRVELDGSGDIILTQGGEESLVIEGEDNIVELVTSEVRGETLYLDFKPNTSFTTTRTLKFHVGMKDVESLKIDGSGNIEFSGLESTDLEFTISGSGDMLGTDIDCTNLVLNIDGSGDIKFDELNASTLKVGVDGSGNVDVDKVYVERVDIDIDGSGNIKLEGETDKLEFDVGGSGELRCGDLKAQDVVIRSGGSGTATVWATESLDISVSGSGDVRYYGRPSLNQRISGSGDVHSMGEK